MEQVIFRAMVFPGDLMMLTGAVRDLHLAHPSKFATDVDTTCRQIWDNNPYITPVDTVQSFRYINVGYPPYSHSETHPKHLGTRYHNRLSDSLGVQIPVTQVAPEIHLSAKERSEDLPQSLGLRKPYWVLIAGGKYDTTTKWWNPASYQEVVDQLDGKVDFVQCGSDQDWHQPMRGAVYMVGKTDIRQLIQLIYHADGVLCPVTFAMHLAAAVPTRSGRPRACVVIVGGRETPSLIQYPNHTLLHLVGQLPCCQEKGCWRYVCQETAVQQVTRSRCEYPVQVSPELKIPLCMNMITPRDVMRAILRYYPGLGPTASYQGWQTRLRRSYEAEAKPFAYTHPRHLQEMYERAGGKNVYGRAVRSARDLERLTKDKGQVSLLLIGNLLEDSQEIAQACIDKGIDRVYGEYGWFPHYETEHADPLGYAWESSLCSLPFSRITASQRRKAEQFRQQRNVPGREALPEGIRPPFVLWPLQLIADRVNRYDLNVSDWHDLLLWTRQILPTQYQLVIKQHPVRSNQQRLEGARYFTNTLVLDYTAPLRPLLEHSAGVIGNNSTVLLESRLLFDKPTWAYGRSWYTGHPDLIFPIKMGEMLPHRELLGKDMDDPWSIDYRNWFIWQLLARQYPSAEAKRNPHAFLHWIQRRTANSYAALGEDAFY